MQPIEQRPYYEIDDNLKELYLHIMEEEANFSKFRRTSIPDVTEITKTAEQIGEIAKSAFLTRCYNHFYGLGDAEFGLETDGAHTNLVIALVDRALSYIYGDDFGEPGSNWPRTIDGYSYREITEAARQHDLPENVIGDIPDNGSTDHANKAKQEEKYLREFNGKFPIRESKLARQAYKLFKEMNAKSSPTGHLLYAADKTAAIIIALTLDSADHPPIMDCHDPETTDRDHAEMELCDYHRIGGEFVTQNDPDIPLWCIAWYRGSEMWTIDSLHIRHILADNDESGFFTALTVMYTLMVNGKWYNWRERDYEAYHKEHGSDRDYSKFNPDAKFE